LRPTLLGRIGGVDLKIDVKRLTNWKTFLMSPAIGVVYKIWNTN